MAPKPRRKRWHQDFLDAIQRFGTVSAACAVARISRMTYYRELKSETFRDQVRDAHEHHKDTLILKLTQLALASERDGCPKSVTLSALMYLLNRADRLTAGIPVSQGSPDEMAHDPDSIIITVTAELAEALLTPPGFRTLQDHNGNGNKGNLN